MARPQAWSRGKTAGACVYFVGSTHREALSKRIAQPTTIPHSTFSFCLTVKCFTHAHKLYITRHTHIFLPALFPLILGGIKFLPLAKTVRLYSRTTIYINLHT